ncbi:UNVERIFIED_CONTAM: hypothetical protein Slati_2584000 [Sesamum latifolium]|uniref:Coenzyme Q-binding protein COQ10 START domain-containing protein n=1 Tax=Sesamum latifolium TaxID=2727402 RepID=A0AAW2VX24_9LAMI
MSQFKPASKTLGHLVLGRNLFRQRMTNYKQIRCLSSVSGWSAFSSSDNLVGGGYRNYYGNSFSTSEVVLQKRGFLGCVDGEVGNMLSKVYEERRVLGFLPWCERSKIIRHNPDGTFDAELEIGFKFLAESYVSHVELSKPKSIKTTSSQSTLFDHLINAWEFNPGPIPGTCNLYFLVDFKFKSPLYRQIANMFFKEVVSRLVGSFCDRCQLIYGPAVPVLENSYERG